MQHPALLSRVLGALDGLGIAYMVSGSIVSSLQGEPRSTHDVDLVVDISPASVPDLVAALSDATVYLDEQAIVEAVATGDLFNLIDTSTGDKVDFWPLTDEPFDRSRFGRRVTLEALGMRLSVSTPEDTIVMKLAWALRSGGSEKQYRDALGVYEVQAGRLDEGYLRMWAGRLGVGDLLDRVLAEAERVED